MASERLSEEELTNLREIAGEEGITLRGHAIQLLVDEVRAHRALLTPEDVEALASLRATIELEGRYGSKVNRALSALDKLLAQKEQG